MLKKVYLTLCGLMLAGYTVTSLSGREWRSAKKQVVPPSARQSPGGYRSYFWYSGFRGGK